MERQMFAASTFNRRTGLGSVCRIFTLMFFKRILFIYSISVFFSLYLLLLGRVTNSVWYLCRYIFDSAKAVLSFQLYRRKKMPFIQSKSHFKEQVFFNHFSIWLKWPNVINISSVSFDGIPLFLWKKEMPKFIGRIKYAQSKKRNESEM